MSLGMMNNVFAGGDSIMNAKGVLNEIIDGDVRSEVKNDRTIISDKKIVTHSKENLEQHSEEHIQNNSAEKSKMF